MKNPVVVKRTYLSILDTLPDIERAIVDTKDQAFRNRSIVRLARLDQGLAAMRDTLGGDNYDD